ncbi:hypothetical protein HYY75_09660 [bacterium]|nr:hypothetical protein [bacterium]
MQTENGGKSKVSDGTEPQVESGINLDKIEKIKADLETSLETVLFWLTCIWFGIAGGFIAIALEDRSAWFLLEYTHFPFCMGILCLILYNATDNYYVLNVFEKRIFYHFKVFWFKKITPFLNSEDIAFIGVTSIYCSNDDTIWHEYKIILVDRKGNSIPLSDPNQNLQTTNQKAKLFAQILGCKFEEGREKASIQIDKSANGEVAARLVDEMVMTSDQRAAASRKIYWMVIKGTGCIVIVALPTAILITIFLLGRH